MTDACVALVSEEIASNLARVAIPSSVMLSFKVSTCFCTCSTVVRCSTTLDIRSPCSLAVREFILDNVCLWNAHELSPPNVVGLENSYEECVASNRLRLSCFAATTTLSFSTSVTKETAHLALRPAARNDDRLSHGPSEASYFSSFVMKSRNGNWQASAIPRIALTWLRLSSVGSRASRCCKACLRLLSSTTAF